MMKTNPTRRGPKSSEEGYILVAVMFMLAILVIAMAVAVPRIAKSIQRDREIETMHRGKQFARAVKLYYKKFGNYPNNLDALVKTNEIRFLRKKYIDPTTGKEEWKPVRYGQNKAPTAMGFFGQPIGGTGMSGGLCGNALPGSIPSSGSSSSFGGSSSSFGSSSSSFGSSFSPGSSNPMAGCPPTDTSTTGNANTNGGTISNGSTDPNAPNGSTDPNNPNGGQNSGDSNGTATPGTGTGLNGQQFGGGPIIGFSPNSPKQSLLVYKKKNHYNEWEFVYDPLADQMMQQNGITGNNGGFGINGTSSPGTGGLGSNSGGSGGSPGGFGSSGGSGSGSGAPTPQPQTPPQQ